jgi:hypothetical protein
LPSVNAHEVVPNPLRFPNRDAYELAPTEYAPIPTDIRRADVKGCTTCTFLRRAPPAPTLDLTQPSNLRPAPCAQFISVAIQRVSLIRTRDGDTIDAYISTVILHRIGDQIARIASRYSSVREPLSLNATPAALSSGARYPMPTPRQTGLSAGLPTVCLKPVISATFSLRDEV